MSAKTIINIEIMVTFCVIFSLFLKNYALIPSIVLSLILWSVFFAVILSIKFILILRGTTALQQFRKTDDLETKKETLLQTISEVDFDHDMKKFDDEIYTSMRNATKNEALLVLQKIDERKKYYHQKALELIQKPSQEKK